MFFIVYRVVALEGILKDFALTLESDGAYFIVKLKPEIVKLIPNKVTLKDRKGVYVNLRPDQEYRLRKSMEQNTDQISKCTNHENMSGTLG